MTDRTSIIASTQAGRAFPRLAKFLADNTSIAPEVAECALRFACQDYSAAEEATDVKTSWSRAMRQAQGLPPETSEGRSAAAAADPVPAGWARALEQANRGPGA